jgi:hypothetical protein
MVRGGRRVRQRTMRPLAELEVVGADCRDKVARFGGTHDRCGDEPVAQDPCQCDFGHGDATAFRERLDGVESPRSAGEFLNSLDAFRPG